MTYITYKKELSKIDYFNKWDNENYNKLNTELQNQIYNKYLIKCKVFQRDNFKCQNKSCKYDTPLTMHHIKWQKNGGGNTERNCVTLCKTCHKAFHRGKRDISFSINSLVPKHMRGHTFKLNTILEINWKQIKKDMKVIRKNFKNEHGLQLSYADLKMLMIWLENVIDLDDNYND